jgi:Co/Zn/Cd efflux system component
VIQGQLAGSMALQADALDFAGDTATYGLSLFAITQSLAFRSKAALVKGVSLGIMGVYVLAAALWRAFVAGTPDAMTMGWVGILALSANVASALLLLRFRDGDANVRSVWLCSRNDAIGNVAVLCAAGLVAVTATRWADLAVAAIMASLFLSTAWQITRQARGELQAQAA